MAKKKVKQEVVKEEVKQTYDNAPVQEEVKEQAATEEIAMSPLPDEQEPVKEEVKQEVVKEEVKTVKAEKVFYAFCRVSGGLIVDITNSLGEISKKILKSGNTSKLAGDGKTRVFDFRPNEFGITKLTEDEAKQITKALEPTRCWKKGFVFIVDNKAEGYKKAAAQVAKYPLQGTEQLNASATKEVEKFSE